MQIQIPFLKTDLSELEHLPFDERQRILEHCVNAEELQRLSRQHVLAFRLALLIIPIGIVVTLMREQLSLPISILPWLIWFVMGFLIFVYVTSFLIFHFRSSRILKRLLAEELTHHR